MGHIDSKLLRLEYEILNASLEDLAKSAGVPVGILQDQADSEAWAQWWPDAPLKEPSKETSVVQQSDDFIETRTKRLQVFAIAREMYLAPKCLQLEAAIIDAAKEAVQDIDVASDADSLRKLAAIYKDVASRSLLEKILSGADNDSGIPNVIIRNLAGPNAV